MTIIDLLNQNASLYGDETALVEINPCFEPESRLPRDIEPEAVYEHVVGYSDVDMLGHANNAMYMQWAMDAVDYETVSTRPVKEVTINFNHETKAGDLVSVYRAYVEKEDGLHVYIEGKVQETSSFCVEIVF